MPAIKCPLCGYRNLHSSVLKICTSCGTPLSASPATPEEPEDPSLTTQLPMLPSPDQPAGKSTAVQLHPGSVPVRPTERGLAIQSSGALQPSLPGEELEDDEQFQTIVREIKEPARSPLETRGRLPRGLPRRPPDITGTLIYVQEQTYHSTPPGFMDAFSKQLLGAIWTSSREQQPDRDRDKVVTRMRIRCFDGERRDAYLEGVLTGANVALGDDISLWGRMRKGTLVTRRAYNHTTRSIVTSNSASSQMPVLVILLVILAVVSLWTFWNHFPLLPK